MAKTAGASLKEKKTVSISTYLLNQSNDLIESGEFSSLSDIVTTAMTEFFTRAEVREEDNRSPTEIKATLAEYLKSPEGKALIRSIIQESLASPSKNSQPIVVEDIIE